jgi:hypothetical protein
MAGRVQVAFRCGWDGSLLLLGFGVLLEIISLVLALFLALVCSYMNAVLIRFI